MYLTRYKVESNINMNTWATSLELLLFATNIICKCYNFFNKISNNKNPIIEQQYIKW